MVLVPERTGWHGDCFRQVRSPAAAASSVPACVRRPWWRAVRPRGGSWKPPDIRGSESSTCPWECRDRRRARQQTQAEARDLLAESNSALQLAADAPLVVSTGRLAAGRGWEQLLAAWSIVARQKVAARLWLAGEAPAAAAVVQRIEALGLSGRVGLIGMFDDVECLLAAADVLVAPAADGSPQSLVEAMAAGVPSVAIDVPLNRWLLGDDAAGLLVPPENAAALAAAILRLLDDPALAARLGAAGWQRAEAEFDLGKMVEGYCELFDCVGAKSGGMGTG